MKKGDICIVKLDVGAGREQFGERPAILISDTKTKVAVVIPLTANIEALRFSHVLIILPDKKNNLKQESVALVFHIRAVDKSRIVKIIGKIDLKSQKRIDKTLKEMLGL
ncbi:type II toxin-antitoxin system PemK/MazF family toxin [Patescibacteria group bacterium]|nr:type II toxin-antitoxin system PemK/MazF family toxin [Patescibacteria group bacterium]MBU2633313.1 type II toxin-antitoxin system PemK/MazF family toxin [Patescibacteria group bacterium]